MKLAGSLSLSSLLFILLSPWHISWCSHSLRHICRDSGLLLASAALVNFTIDDTSSLIAYSPPDKWRSSTQACSTCLQPDSQLAYAGTWHDGTSVTTVGGDVLARRKVRVDKLDAKDDAGDESQTGNGSKNMVRSKPTQQTKPTETAQNAGQDQSGEASEDAESVDQSLSAAFSFTGSAIYVYALVPEFVAATNGTPTSVNLSYTLDSKPAGTYSHTGSPSSNTTSYLSSLRVFQQAGLDEGPHTLVMNVTLGSTFLLDYIVYTQESLISFEDDNSTSASLGVNNTTSISVGVPSGSAAFSQTTSATSQSSKSHNVATFAGAVGGSVGLLAVLALSLAFSLYRRRLRARRRDRAYRESHRGQNNSVNSFHTDASEDGPPMQGPAPFVPRYFPGTVINAAPPPYSPPAPPSNSPTSGLLGSPETPVPSMLWSSRRQGAVPGDSDSASYADRPPPTPPVGVVPEFEDGYFAPPPSFQVAIATPVPAILAGLSGTTSTSPSPAPRPSTPTSPVIPLLAPPPRSRPIPAMHLPLQTPGAGPSGTNSLPSSEQLSSSRSSIHILSEESSLRIEPTPITLTIPPAFTSTPTLSPVMAGQSEVDAERDRRRESDRNSIGQ